MILVTHSLIGVALTKSLDNNWLIFFMAFFTHFLFDAIPHYHYDISAIKDLPPDENRLKVLFGRIGTSSSVKIASDLLLAFVLPFVFLKPGSFNYLSVFLAIFGALIPDFFGAIWWMNPSNKILSVYQSFHRKMHLKMQDLLKGMPIFGTSLNIIYTLAALYFILF